MRHHRLERSLAAITALAAILTAGSGSAAPPMAGHYVIGPHIRLLGEDVPPGERRTLRWRGTHGLGSTPVSTPVLVVNGLRNGPTLCLTAAVHGDELNGIEIVRKVVHETDPETLRGALIGVPIVNLSGFQNGSRYLPDRRDLNRHFPGNRSGSAASRLAHGFFNDIVSRCSVLVDIHTGSFHRSNLPQIRADMNDPDARELAEALGSLVVLHHPGLTGTLRHAAMGAGIPAVTLEAGGPQRLESEAVRLGAAGIRSLIDVLGLYPTPTDPLDSSVYSVARWVRADTGGLLVSNVELGDDVYSGYVLGTVTDPVSNESLEIRAPTAGRVLGMALDQYVQPGFAAYRIGVTSEVSVLPDDVLLDEQSESHSAE